MSNQLTIFELVEKQETLFTPVLSDPSIVWEKEKQFAIQHLQKSEYLYKAAMGNVASFQNAIINVASIGISLNPANRHAYLVPRDGMVCLDIGYIGLLHLAMQGGAIQWGQCKLVMANDNYVNNGLDKEPTHEYKAFGDRGDIVGGYCTVKTASGDYLTEEMFIGEINSIMMSSKSYASAYSPWKKYFTEMARKTIVKRASKYWPTVDRLNKAIEYLNNNGEGLVEEKGIDETTINNEQLDELLSAIEKSGRTNEHFCKWACSAFKREVLAVSDLYASEFDKALNMVVNS